jgi:anti-sigma regulatory factor (Ser/Thr protein kinase)
MRSAGPGRASAHITLRSDARELRRLRQQLKELFNAQGVRTDLGDDLILVANELTTNAIEASPLGANVTVDVHVDDAEIVLAVENIGVPFELPETVELPDRTNMRGRGLALSSRIVDELCAEPTVEGTRVVATCRRG